MFCLILYLNSAAGDNLAEAKKRGIFFFYYWHYKLYKPQYKVLKNAKIVCGTLSSAGGADIKSIANIVSNRLLQRVLKVFWLFLSITEIRHSDCRWSMPGSWAINADSALLRVQSPNSDRWSTATTSHNSFKDVWSTSLPAKLIWASYALQYACAHAKGIFSFAFNLFTYSYFHILIYWYIHVFMYSYIHVFIYSCIYVYWYIHVFMYSCVHVFMYSCIHVFMYSCIHIFIYSYTDIFMY